MSGKRAKAIWKAVAGPDASRKKRQYFIHRKTGVITRDGLRQAYQDAKKRNGGH